MKLLSLIQRPLWLVALIAAALTHASPLKRNDIQSLTTTSSGDEIFELGNITFLANLQYPKITLASTLQPQNNLIPSTVVYTNGSSVSGQYLKSVLAKYKAIDDVFTEDFLGAVFVISSVKNAQLDTSAMSFLSSMNLSQLVLSSSFAQANNVASGALSFIEAPTIDLLPPGPYAATISSSGLSLSSVYRLYSDSYRDFLFGAFESNNGQGDYKALGVFLPKFWDPMIPVPSRIYSMYDSRPFAGERVAIKDLFDIKGLQTSGGSQAWAYITPIANETAPSVQRIIDLGGVVVGKYKLAQFASGANPWEWQDEHYPFNPRGDGW
jgi:hypothetical protein